MIEQLLLSQEVPLRSLSLDTWIHRALHFLRWLYTWVAVTSWPQNSNTCFATVFKCTSLNPLLVLTPLEMSSHILFSTNMDMKGCHFMLFPLPSFFAFAAAVSAAARVATA